MIKIIVKKENENKTIKFFLQSNFLISNSEIEKILKKNVLKINNNKVKFNYILKINDEIKLFKKLRNKEIDYSFLKSNDDFFIIYEDTNILIINKKEGEFSQKNNWEKTNDLNSKIKKYLFLKKEWNPECDKFAPNLCHRIDFETKGLIIAAKNLKSMNEIINGLKNNLIQKKYIACVEGNIKKNYAVLENFIEKDLSKKNLMKINKNERKINSVLEYEKIKFTKNYSVVSINLKTGKKHQIRLQFSDIGHPILGDKKYNELNYKNFKFLHLWSKELVFQLPENSSLNYLNKLKFEIKINL